MQTLYQKRRDILLRASTRSLVEQWHPKDIRFHTDDGDDDLRVAFTGPARQVVSILGFPSGAGTRIVRFAPTHVGMWNYKVESGSPALAGMCGTVLCLPKSDPYFPYGRPVPSVSSLPGSGSRARGVPWRLREWACDPLPLLDRGGVDIPKARDLIDDHAKAGFTQVSINLFGAAPASGAARVAGAASAGAQDFDPGRFAWFSGWGSGEWLEMEPSFWERMDRIMDYLLGLGLVARIPVSPAWAGRATGASDRRLLDGFFRYLAIRYQAYPNMVWDPYSQPSQPSAGPGEDARSRSGEEARLRVLRLLKAVDAYGRLRVRSA